MRFVEETNRRIAEALTLRGATASFHVCPHTAEDRCTCRKPAPGLLLRAARVARVDVRHAWMVGDHETDVLAAKRAGCALAVHVLSGRQATPSTTADLVVDDLAHLDRLTRGER